MTLLFVGSLPTYVGMYVGSFSGEKQHLSVYGPNGIITVHDTFGHGGHPDTHTPYVPKQYVELESANGIQRINIYGACGSRVAGFLDDITYEFRPVAEPSLLVLFCLGFVSLSFRYRTLHR